MSTLHTHCGYLLMYLLEKRSDVYVEEPVIIVRFPEFRLLFLLPKVSIPVNAKTVTEMCHTTCTDVSTCGHRNSFAFHFSCLICTEKMEQQECTSSAEVPRVALHQSSSAPD